MSKKIGDIAFITKLAGFEHTTYIQGNCIHEKKSDDYIPLFIGKTVRNGRIDTNFDWYIHKNISASLERSKLTKKCLVLPYVGTIGDLAVYDASYPAHLGSNIAKIELHDNSLYTEEFIYYFLKSPYGQKLLLKDVQGGIQKNITMGAIRDVELPEISLIKQNHIVSILKALDDKIENNTDVNIELEAMAKTIYDYWFLQFEFPDENGKPYKSSGGKMIWNEDLNREIPDGWAVKKIGEILQKPPTTKKYKTEDYLSTGAYPIIDQSEKYICGYTNSKEDLLFLKDCIIFGDHTKYIKYVNFPFARGADGTQVLISSEPNLSNYLFYQQIKNMPLVTQGYSRYFKFLKDKFVLIPSNYINDIYSGYSVILTQKQYSIILENKELSELRDFLLPLLMNGQVGFKEAK